MARRSSADIIRCNRHNLSFQLFVEKSVENFFEKFADNFKKSVNNIFTLWKPIFTIKYERICEK